jgi:hypothetical protein
MGLANDINKYDNFFSSRNVPDETPVGTSYEGMVLIAVVR